MRFNRLKCRILQNLAVTQASFGKIARFVGPQYPKLGQLAIKGMYDVEIGQEVSIRFMANRTKADNRLVWQGFQYYVPYTKWFWMELVRRTRLLAEFGAGYGEFTLAALAKNPSVTIHVFEASAVKVKALKKSLALNPGFGKRCRVQLIEAEDHEREACFESFFQAIHQSSPIAHEPVWAEEEDSDFTDDGTNLYTFTLPEVIRMDASLANSEALNGLVNGFTGYKPVVIAGVESYESFADLKKWVASKGYRWYQFNEELRKIETIPFYRHKLGPNYILYPPKKEPLITAVIEAQLYAQTML